MEIKKMLTEKDANRLNIVHYELLGKQLIIRLISQAKNYDENLFEEKEEELINLTAEFDLLASSMVEIYFSKKELEEVTNNYKEKYYIRFNGARSNPSITIITGELNEN